MKHRSRNCQVVVVVQMDRGDVRVLVQALSVCKGLSGKVACTLCSADDAACALLSAVGEGADLKGMAARTSQACAKPCQAVSSHVKPCQPLLPGVCQAWWWVSEEGVAAAARVKDSGQPRRIVRDGKRVVSRAKATAWSRSHVASCAPPKKGEIEAPDGKNVLHVGCGLLKAAILVVRLARSIPTPYL